MDTIKQFIGKVIYGTKKNNYNENENENENKQIVYLIKKHRIPYVVIDRRDKKELRNFPLSKYNEAKHQIIIDAQGYVSHILE